MRAAENRKFNRDTFAKQGALAFARSVVVNVEYDNLLLLNFSPIILVLCSKLCKTLNLSQK